eukprot:scaffold40438_cov67-Phaeocystis_antarctica.AAC.4
MRLLFGGVVDCHDALQLLRSVARSAVNISVRLRVAKVVRSCCIGITLPFSLGAGAPELGRCVRFGFIVAAARACRTASGLSPSTGAAL